MAYKRRSSMIQGSRLHKEKLALNCSMDNTSGPDGRANSSAFQHNNHGGADFIENHFASGMHRSDGPMQKHTPAHTKAQEPENPNLNAELAKLTGDDRPDPTYEGTDYFGPKGVSRDKAEPRIPGQTGQTSDYEREFMNDMMATGKGPRKPKIGPMQETEPYKYKNGYHLPKKKTEGPYLETERDVRSAGNIAGRAALSGLATGGVGTVVSLIKNLNKRKDAEAYNAGFEQSDSDAMEL